MKYNPMYHRSVVGNLRTKYDEKNPKDPLVLHDEQVWEIFEENHGIEITDEPEATAKYGGDVAIYLALEENNNAPQ